MKATSLFGVLVLAKVMALAGRDVAIVPWTPVAYLWQDAAVALAFAAFDRAIRSPRLSWAAYGLLVLYAAVNVPVTRVLSTPLTLPMLRAARGTLADSIAHYVTLSNVSAFAFALAAGVLLPLAVRKLSPRANAALLATGLVLLLLGPTATRRVPTQGLHRSPLIALGASFFPRISPGPPAEDPRRTDLSTPPVADLSRYRGAAAGRNVVLVMLESTGASYLRPYGADLDPMPNLSRLAETAVLFENAYAVYPESIKTLVAVLDSVHPALDVPAERYERLGSSALPRVLSAAGYRTALFHSGRFGYLGMDSVIANRGYETRLDAGDVGGERNSSFGVDEPSTVKRILSWVRELAAGERFFVTYLPVAGHHPYDAPEPGPFPRDREIDAYRNALHAGDRALGELLEGLSELGLSQKTLFVFLGDHGEAFQQHAGNVGHSFFLYEENVRVPFMVAAPGLFGEQVRSGVVASHVDVAPTVLELLGLAVPDGYEGRSLLDESPRVALFLTDYSLAFLGLRDGPWKFIHELGSGRCELFDLVTDPREVEDLSQRLPERVRAYTDRLLGWSASQRARVDRVPAR